MKYPLSSSRRIFLQLMLALPLVRLLRHVPGTAADDPGDDIIEVNGWILKGKDLA